MTWRFGILAATLLGLAACGGQSAQNTALRLILNEDKATTGQFARFTPLRKAGRGPALDIRIKNTGVRGGFLRESKSGNIESWLGTDGVGLTFDRGVLHGTRGLGTGLLASDVSSTANAVLSGRSGQVERLHTYLNGDDQAVTRTFVCTITNQGTDTITIDETPTSTRRMSETCGSLIEEFENVYWVDTRRGRIVKSQQWAGATVGLLDITTVYDF